MTVTHTYAVLEVPAAVYAAVRALLDQAKHDHAFVLRTDGEVIDMHGIALKSRDPQSHGSFEVGSILSSRTREGAVEISMNGELAQMELSKAREVVRMLQEAIEAAVSDQVFWEFATKRLGLSEQAAGAALMDLREIRQGSRGVVNPN